MQRKAFWRYDRTTVGPDNKETAHLVEKRSIPATFYNDERLNLTDKALKEVCALPPSGTFKATVEEVYCHEWRYAWYVHLRMTLSGEYVLHDKHMVAARSGQTSIVQAGRRKLRQYVDMAGADVDLSDFGACLDAIVGMEMEVDVEHLIDGHDGVVNIVGMRSYRAVDAALG